ncbi:MAG TPA: DUF6263 family protein [Ferruginibacter sp.]|nr:DUF6263 family protein [Ferruginibacter sp.]HMP21506.1 DUF6263 family protein [Ferruginibacter sp.]
MIKFTQHLLLLATTISYLQVYAQKTTGKLSLSEGQQLKLEQAVKISSTLNLMGQEVNMTADANMEYNIAVQKKMPAAFLLNSTLKKMKSAVTAMGETQHYDSDKPEDNNTETGKIVQGMINKPAELEIGADGAVLNSKPAADYNTNSMNMVQGLLSGNDNYAGASEAFLVIPAGIKKGDSWQDSSQTDGMKLLRNFTLTAINGNRATVTVSGTQYSNKTVEQMGMEIAITVEAVLNGEAVVNINNGIIEQKTITAKGTGNAEMMGQSIPMTTLVTSSSIVK